MRRAWVWCVLALACATPPRAPSAITPPATAAPVSTRSPSIGPPLELTRETKREVALSPIGFSSVMFAADGAHVLGRVKGGWALGAEKLEGESFTALEFSPDGHRLLVQHASTDSFDVLDTTSGKLVARVSGHAPGWTSSGRLAFLDAASHIVRADAENPTHRETGVLVACPMPRESFHGSGECQLGFADDTDALFYTLDYGKPHALVHVSDRGVTDVLASSDSTRMAFRFGIGATGALCLSRESPKDAFAPSKPLAVPTEISCAPPPWDRFEVVMRGDHYYPELQVLADAVLVSSVVEPELRVYSPTTGTPRRHCIARFDTLVSRCCEDPRFAMGWTVLPDGKTVIVESKPPNYMRSMLREAWKDPEHEPFARAMWPHAWILDLEARTFAPFGVAGKEYGGVAAIPGRSDAFTIGLDGEDGEGDRSMLMVRTMSLSEFLCNLQIHPAGKRSAKRTWK